MGHIKPIDQYEYEEVYNQIARKFGEETIQEQIEFQREQRKYTYIVKTITSGKMRECEIYPVWPNRAAVPKVEKSKSRIEQQNLNNKNAQKKVVRLVNANFDKKDIMITLTYDDDYIPTEEQARKDIRNYFDRIRRYRKKKELSELKYIYVIEYMTKEEQEQTKKIRIHHHVIMSGMDRDDAERIWGKGRSTECRRLKPDDFGLEGLAKYITKAPKEGTRRWGASLNLTKPVETKNRTRLTKRKVEKLVLDENGMCEMFGKLYEGYVLNDFTTYLSNFVAGYYIYAKFRKENINNMSC